MPLINIPTISRANKTLLIFSCLSILFGCNLSDDTERLPGGHTFVSEGHCYNFILISFAGAKEITSFIADYRYNDHFLTVLQIDSASCEHPSKSNAINTRFFIVDNSQKKVVGPLSQTAFTDSCTQLSVPADLRLLRIDN